MIKKLIIIATMFSLVLSTCSYAAMFPDVENHWAKQYVETLAMEGAISGMGDGSFAPDALVTREQFLKMLLITTSENANVRKSFEEPPKLNIILENSPFSDVDPKRWSYYYIKQAYGTVISPEEYNDKFYPVKDITREEAAVWMARALDLEPAEASFKDEDSIENKEMVGAAFQAGLIEGFEDGRFGPKETLTRAQAATMLSRALKYNYKKVSRNFKEVVKDFSRDLNGDGKDEKIKVKAGEEQYALFVDDHIALGGLCDVALNKYYIIDIDKNDDYKEIAVAENNYNFGALAIYRYTGSSLYLMGYIETVGEFAVRTDDTPIGDEWGALCINMDGTITGNIGEQFVHTMLLRRQYKINEKYHLAPVAEEYYTIGSYSEFTVVNELVSPLNDAAHPPIVLKEGYTGKIIKTDLKNWIYIETGSGDSGWIYVNDDGLINGESLSYYLDGLWYAG